MANANFDIGVVIALFAVLLAAPVIVYYYVIKKDVWKGIITVLKIEVFGLLAGWIFDLGSVFQFLVESVAPVFLVFAFWHNPRVKAGIVFKYFVWTFIIQFVAAFALLGFAVIRFWSELQSMVGGL